MALRALLAVVGVVGISSLAAATPVPVPTLEQMLDIRQLGPTASVALSPDGEWLAYAIAAKKKWPVTEAAPFYGSTGMVRQVGQDSEIWVARVSTGEVRNVTAGRGSSTAPAWSPDSQALLFVSDRDGYARLWTWNRLSGAVKRVSADIQRHPSNAPVWSPDGKWIAVTLLSEGFPLPGAAEPKESATAQVASESPPVLVYRSAAASLETAQSQPDGISRAVAFPELLTDLALVDVASGQVRRLDKQRHIEWMAFSPDGTSLAYGRDAGIETKSGQGLTDFIVVDVASGQTRVLAPDAPVYNLATMRASWSPDSKHIAYITHGTGSIGELRIIDVASGQERRIPSHADARFDTQPLRHAHVLWSADGGTLFYKDQQRLWMLDARNGQMTPLPGDTLDKEIARILSNLQGNVAFSPKDRSSLTVLTRDPRTKAMGMHRYDLKSKRWTSLREQAWYIDRPMVADSGKELVFTAEDAAHPLDFWVADASMRNPRRVTHLNPAFEQARLGSSQVMKYRAPDGNELDATLLLPVDYRAGTRYPLVVWVYPGGTYVEGTKTSRSHANFLNSYGIMGVGMGDLQILASRGYAAVVPELPQRVGTPMRDLVAGVHAAVDRVIELGIADPDRMAIRGHSYGGYSTIAMLVSSGRFKAGAMSAGFADLIGMYGNMTARGASQESYMERSQGLIGATLWERRDLYIENSPIFFLDKVTAPLLIMHGDADTVPVRFADQIFVGLRRLGKPVEYRRYPGVSHGFDDRGVVMDHWQAVLRWFDRYVKGRALD